MMLADRVVDDAAAIALLDVGQSERGDFGAEQAATEQDSEDGAVARAFAGGRIGRVEKALGVDLAEPDAGVGGGQANAPDIATPAASCGSSRPLSAASLARGRMADSFVRSPGVLGSLDLVLAGRGCFQLDVDSITWTWDLRPTAAELAVSSCVLC
jgi:hypothetical protein